MSRRWAVPFALSILQRAELAFPGEGVGHDGCKAVELRLPPQQLASSVGLRHDPCRIAGTWAGAIDTKIHARHAFDLSMTSSAENPWP
jgi:hypothetical protein